MNPYDPFDVSDPEPPYRRALKLKRFKINEEVSDHDGPTSEAIDLEATLPGAVLMVSNHHWGIESTSSTDHPGICTEYQPGTPGAVLVSGTTARQHRHGHVFFIVQPTRGNGLRNATAFRLVPRVFPVHRLRLHFPKRHLGHLGEDTLQALRAELIRVHSQE